MVSKTNTLSSSITADDLDNHMDSAFSIMNTSRLNAATAIAHLWQIYSHAQSGDGKNWFIQRVDAYNNLAETENHKVDARFEEADKFKKGELAADHAAVKKTSSQQEKDLQLTLQNTLRSDAAISKLERRKLKYVTLKDRENSNEFAYIVRIGLRLYYPDQAMLVSRNCYAMEFIKAKFANLPSPTIDEVVAAFEEAGGFDAAIEKQRLVKQDGGQSADIRAVSKAAIRAAAREKVRMLPAIAEIEMPITHTKDGFANILVRVKGKIVEVVAEADAPDVEIEATVNRIGSYQQIDADPKSEVAGRLLEFSKLVPYGQAITGDDGKQGEVTSQQHIIIRPGADSKPEFVVSSSRVDAGPVMIARPHDSAFMGLGEDYLVLHGKERKKLEKSFHDRGERSIRTITVDLDPKTAEGNPAESIISWVCENLAVKAANETRAREKLPPLPEIEQVYWGDFNNLAHKPLDIDGFTPQLLGVLNAADMADIIDLFPKPGDASKTGNDGTKNGKASRLSRTVQLTFDSDMLKVVNGDANTLELDCRTGTKGVVSVTLRMQDLMALFTTLRSYDCQKVEIEPDDRGLVKFSWQDSYASYAIHFPTCSADAKLSSKRVATMRAVSPAMAQAAE